METNLEASKLGCRTMIPKRQALQNVIDAQEALQSWTCCFAIVQDLCDALGWFGRYFSGSLLRDVIASQEKCVFLFEGLRCSTLQKTNCIPSRMKKGGETKVTLAQHCTSPYNTREHFFATPQSSVALSRFTPSTRFKVPFTASLVGIVADLQDAETTSTGKAERVFDLVDEAGHWMTCCAMERNAYAGAFRNGVQVVILHATARPGLGSMEAMCYMYKDSVLVALNLKPKLVPKRTKVELLQTSQLNPTRKTKLTWK